MKSGWPTIAIMFGVCASLVALAAYVSTPNYRNEYNHLYPGVEYTCAICTWFGHPNEMYFEVEGNGSRAFYCPLCGGYMGWQAENDSYPVISGLYPLRW